MHPDVHAFFDEATNTITYLLHEPNGRACAVIDSVLDFDYASGRTDTRSADAVIAYWQSIYPEASEVTIPILSSDSK